MRLKIHTRFLMGVMVGLSLYLVPFAYAHNAAAGAKAVNAKQLNEGRHLYETHCAKCHGANLHGYSGPALIGDHFRDAYTSQHKLFGFISDNMPLNAPGSLSHNDYDAISAFIMSRNGKSK